LPKPIRRVPSDQHEQAHCRQRRRSAWKEPDYHYGRQSGWQIDLPAKRRRCPAHDVIGFVRGGGRIRGQYRARRLHALQARG
ncbi:hypothetical protein ABTN02_20420, partial [Acinetobacter baumannii]